MMKGFHVITGLPRSGSTLLCNLLNQNPKFHASSTSVIAASLATLSNLWSNAPEIKSDLAVDRDYTEAQMMAAAKALVDKWYQGQRTKIVFDKSRAWSHNALLLKQLYPDAKIIATVRDPRAVFASIEKRHREMPILDHAATPMEKEIFTRADQMFGPDGMVGVTIRGVLDLQRRAPPGTVFVQYETFAQNPQMVMDRLYSELGEDPFKHDFEKIENTATDLDALYLNKFPHDGSGAVAPPDQDEWKTYVAPDLASQIMQAYPMFNQAFGYVA